MSMTFHPSHHPVIVDGPMWQARCQRCGWYGDAYGNPETAFNEAREHQCKKRKPPQWFQDFLEDEL